MVSSLNAAFIKHAASVHHQVYLQSLSVHDDWLHQTLPAVATADLSDLYHFRIYSEF